MRSGRFGHLIRFSYRFLASFRLRRDERNAAARRDEPSRGYTLDTEWLITPVIAPSGPRSAW